MPKIGQFFTASSSESHPDIPRSIYSTPPWGERWGKLGSGHFRAQSACFLLWKVLLRPRANLDMHLPWSWVFIVRYGSHFGTEVLKRSASISVSYLRQVDLWPDLHPCTSLYSMSQNDAYHKIAMLFLGEVIINQWMEWVNCRLSLRIAAICFIYSKAGCSRRMGVCNGSKSCTKIWMVKYYNIL